MQRWLSVEDDIVVVVQMTLNHVANLQVLVSSVLEDSKVGVAACSILDVLGTGPVVSSSINKLSQVLLIMLSDHFRDCKVHGNLNWNSKLVQPQVWIRRNDRSS
jgi:hypothetical protein